MMPFCAATPRKPVTASSRRAIATAIQAGTRGSGGIAASMMRLATTISLSASGSRNCPSVVMPWRRASQPSRKSVTQATRKGAPATARATGPGQKSTTTSTGTRPMRSMLSRFGSAVARPAPAAVSATGLADTRALPEVAEPVAEHADQILAGLGDVRDPTDLVHPHGPGIVRREREREVAVVAVEETAQVLHASLDVVLRRESVHDPHFRRSVRHELHQPLRSLWRDGQVVESRLGLDDRLHQRILHGVPVGNHADHLVERRRRSRNRGRRRHARRPARDGLQDEHGGTEGPRRLTHDQLGTRVDGGVGDVEHPLAVAEQIDVSGSRSGHAREHPEHHRHPSRGPHWRRSIRGDLPEINRLTGPVEHGKVAAPNRWTRTSWSWVAASPGSRAPCAWRRRAACCWSRRTVCPRARASTRREASRRAGARAIPSNRTSRIPSEPARASATGTSSRWWYAKGPAGCAT